MGAITIDDRTLSVVDAFREGFRRFEAGLLKQAEAVYRQILAVDPDHADSLNLMGLIAREAGHRELALDFLGRAAALQPVAAHVRNNLGNALQELGRPADAVDHYRAALRLNPGTPEIHNNLGAALRELGRLDEAAAHYRMALHGTPEAAAVHCNLGSVLRELGCLREAEGCFRAAARLQPALADAHYNLANLLVEVGRPDAAEAAFRTALQANPVHAETHNNLGNLLQELGRLAEAERCYLAALRIKPDYPEAYYNLGCAFLAQNRLDAARVCYAQALALNPRYAAARFARCMAELPILYADEAEIARCRAAYSEALARRADEVEQTRAAVHLADGVGASPPFFLACQGEDDRSLQALHGATVCRLMAEAAPRPVLPPPPRPSEPVRVGIVSGFFQRHTVWALLIRGWLTQLDRHRFELFGYHTGTRDDDATSEARTLCDRFQAGRVSSERWRERILADAPHVLLYPEVGIDPAAARLAALRLAPAQCAAWGHPETTGMPTLDYFLSSDLMEPRDADAHYTERLVRLPNLGTYYEPVDGPPLPVGRADLGLRSTATVFWSGQALFKYLPQFDAVFPRIAAAVGDCQFVFIEFARSEQVTDLFRRRLHRAFAEAGLDADRHCVLLPSMEPQRFVAAVGQCDIGLDTIGWSGGKSTLEWITQDLPIVTLGGPLMRSRHTAAILARMDVTETIAHSVDDYVGLAVRLARDAAWRKALRRRIADRKPRLYRDRAYVQALEDFLDRTARRRVRGRR